MQQLQWIDLLGYLTHWYCGIMILFKYCVLEFLCLFPFFFIIIKFFNDIWIIFYMSKVYAQPRYNLSIFNDAQCYKETNSKHFLVIIDFYG